MNETPNPPLRCSEPLRTSQRPLSAFAFPRSHHMKNACRFLIVATTSAVSGWASETDYFQIWRTKMRPISPRHYVCQYTGTVPQIDGRLEDEGWLGAQWTQDFVDIEGSSKPKPALRTRAKMLWDNDYLYIAAEMEEPHVWGTLTDHDSVIFHDPDFEVFIDPDGDTHDYFEFEINALNTGWDLLLRKPYKDGGKADNSFELFGLKTAVHIRGTLNNPADKDDGWNVEIAIPWRALASNANRPTPPRDGDQWRMGFSRVQWQINTSDGKYTKVPNTPESNWVWSPQGVIDMHRPERWAYVQFSRAKAAAFVPDGAESLRDALQDVYYAQRSFRKAHGRWATKLDELALPPAAGSFDVPTLRSTPDGWEARIETFAGSVSQQWIIRQDARIWRVTKP